MGSLLQDLRYGARMLSKKPGFTLIAVITLALGIGANTAIFSVVDAVLLRSLPFRESDRLAMVWRHVPQTNDIFPLNPANFFALREQNQSFEAMAALSNIDWSGNLTGDGEPERLQGNLVSANLFQILGVEPVRGRAFLPDEEQPGRNQVALITNGLWQRRYGADDRAVGKTITLNGQNYTIIGVLPPDFQFVQGVEIWAPLSLALLIGAALLLTTFWRLSRVNPGFDPQNTLAINLALNDPKYAEAQARIAFFEQVLERIRNLPGVNAASAINYIPLAGAGQSSTISVEGRPTPSGESYVPEVSVVTPDYFRAAQIPLLKGRLFDQQDRMDTGPVILVSENMARRLWSGEEPLGKRIKIGGENYNAPWMTVVGVVGDTKHYSLVEEPPMRFYKAYAQAAWNSMTLVVRSEVDVSSLSTAVRREVMAVDRNQPVFNARTFTQLFSSSISQQRFLALLMAAFAGLALLLAVIGIYGVIAYSVAQRTREIGIRVALGAQTSDVLRLVIRQGMTLTVIGVALGLIVSFALTRFMEKSLFGVSATDPLTFTSIALLLAVVALLACYVPARRATKIDPIVALRRE
jgi:hypothetical protein